MAILSDKTIKEYLEEGKIVIDPLKDEQQNPTFISRYAIG